MYYIGQKEWIVWKTQVKFQKLVSPAVKYAKEMFGITIWENWN